MAFAGESDPEKIKKLRKEAKKLGVKELFYTESPIEKIEITKTYQLRTVEDMKLLPKDLQKRLFTQSGLLRKYYSEILGILFLEGAISPDGKSTALPGGYENWVGHLVQIGLIEYEEPSKYRISKPEIARALLGGYRLPLWKR